MGKPVTVVAPVVMAYFTLLGMLYRDWLIYGITEVQVLLTMIELLAEKPVLSGSSAISVTNWGGAAV